MNMIASDLIKKAKVYLKKLNKTKDAEVPKYAVGFVHTNKAVNYAIDVLNNKVLASDLVKQKCENFLNELLTENSIYYFDAIKAERPCAFIETLCHVKGKWARVYTRITLETWQCFIVCNLFGFILYETSFRRFTEAYIEVPRKNGKTLLVAGIAIYMFLADGEPGAEIYCGATTKKQAEEVFKPARQMMMRNKALRVKYSPDIKTETVKLEDGSIFTKIIGKPMDGASPHCSILDEVHQHPNGDLYESQQTGLGAREQPLLIMITTAGYDLMSFCKYKHDEAVQEIMGAIKQTRSFNLIYSIDLKDLEKLKALKNENDSVQYKQNLEIIKKANPNFGVSLQPSYCIAECEKSFQSTANKTKFLTKMLDVWVNAGNAYFNSSEILGAIDTELLISHLVDKGARCVISVDLNAKYDLGCVMLAFVLSDENGKLNYFLFPNFFLPETVINDTSNLNYRKYQHYINLKNNNTISGSCLNLQSGTETNYIEMCNYIIETAQIYHVEEVIFDPWNAMQMIRECEKHGLNCIEFSQNTKNFSPSMKELQSAFHAKRVKYDGNECLTWNFMNVESKTDNNENDFPRKANLRNENKIDGAICALMAVSRLMVIGYNENDTMYNDHVLDVYGASGVYG